MVKLLNDEDYDVTQRAEHRQIDVTWTASDEIRRLFRDRKLSWQVHDPQYPWTEDELFEEIRGILGAYDDTIDAYKKEITDLKVRLEKRESDIIERENEIMEKMEAIKEAETELADKEQSIRELEGDLLETSKELSAAKSQARSLFRRRSSRGRLRAIAGPSVGAGGDGDEGLEFNFDDDVEFISTVLSVRDRLQIDLRNAEAEIQAVNASKDQLEQALVNIQPLILRLHIYRVPNGTPEIVNAWTNILTKAYNVHRPKTKLAKFPGGKGVVFANSFDTMPYLPEGYFNIQIVLAILGEYTDETVSDQELCAQLAWLNTVLNDINQVAGTEQNAALHRFLAPVVNRDLNGLAASLRNIVIANLAQQSEDLSFYLFKLVHAVDAKRNQYGWVTWTLLERITFVWLSAIHGVSPDWMDADALALSNEIQPSRCSDIIDILKRCANLVKTESDARMFLLESDERDNKDKMVILHFRDTTRQWRDYIWVRHQGRVSFTQKGLKVRLEVIGQTQIWSVKSSFADPWFTVKEEKALEYLDTAYTESLAEEVNRFLIEDAKRDP